MTQPNAVRHVRVALGLAAEPPPGSAVPAGYLIACLALKPTRTAAP